MPHQTLIFDLGGVLVDWNPRYLYRKLFSNEATVERFLQEVCTQEWNEAQDAGRSVAEATRLLVAEFPQHQAEIEAYYSRWEEMLGGQIEGTVQLLEELAQTGGLRLLALTNWSRETFPIARERFEFLSIFEDILVSGEVGLKKPDARIFQMLLDRHGITPADAVFIDDAVHNVAAASALGLHGVHFVSPAALRDTLKSLDLIQ